MLLGVSKIIQSVNIVFYVFAFVWTFYTTKKYLNKRIKIM